MTEPLAPPYPADTRAKGWRFELDYEKIEQSDTWGLAGDIPMAQHALLMMWLVAWRQVPCGSLPADDNLIRAHCRIPPAIWPKVRSVLMRGWWLADDGRMYHDTLVQRVREMIEHRGGEASRKKLFDEKFYAIRARDGGACVYCGATKYLSLDHLVARSRGGGGDDSNLVTACRSCNSRKGARTPDEAGMTFINSAARSLWLSIRGMYLNGFVTRDKDCTNNNKDTGTGTGTTSTPSVQKTARKRAAPEGPPCPDDVDPGVWTDWLAHRRAKKATVTATVIDGARAEAAKAGISFEAFLRIWCRRGTQGLEAAWLSADERRGATVVPINKQEALEKRNRAVGDEWLRQQEAADATR